MACEAIDISRLNSPYEPDFLLPNTFALDKPDLYSDLPEPKGVRELLDFSPSRATSNTYVPTSLFFIDYGRIHADSAEEVLSIFPVFFDNGFLPEISNLKSKIAANILGIPEWFLSFCDSASTAKNAQDIYPLVDGFSDLFLEKSYSKVDDILKFVDMRRFNELSIATLLRTTYPARDRLDSWYEALYEAERELCGRGLDSEKYLKGLR
ncbi:MAG: hypothetical protein COA29_02465 [Porticoccus sp.]|nr:MAG: hypothetical protein COA29_02465 [Porticoccus sp.]